MAIVKFLAAKRAVGGALAYIMNPDKYRERYGISVMIANSNIQMPFFHKHDGYEIYMLLRGDRTYFINDIKGVF